MEKGWSDLLLLSSLAESVSAMYLGINRPRQCVILKKVGPLNYGLQNSEFNAVC